MIKSLILLALLLILTLMPLYLIKPEGEEEIFSGADTKATELITQINPDYAPWFTPIFEPPSSEIESLLFAIQAAIGSGIIGFYFGYMYSRKKFFLGENFFEKKFSPNTPFKKL